MMDKGSRKKSKIQTFFQYLSNYIRQKAISKLDMQLAMGSILSADIKHSVSLPGTQLNGNYGSYSSF